MFLRFLFALTAMLPAATAAQAHAFGERYDLPVPLWMNLTGGGAVVVLSFVIAAWYLKPEAQAPASRSSLSAIPGLRTLGSAPVLLALKIFSVFLFALALLAGFIGLPDYSRNAAPTIFWVIGWVGLAFTSVLLGNVWLIVNPWLILFDGADALWRALTKRSLSLAIPYPRRIGVLPGIVMVVGFTWFMLASGLAGDFRSLACVVSFYSAVTWAGMVVFGAPAWLAHGEAFTRSLACWRAFRPPRCGRRWRALRAADCPPDRERRLRRLSGSIPPRLPGQARRDPARLWLRPDRAAPLVAVDDRPRARWCWRWSPSKASWTPRNGSTSWSRWANSRNSTVCMRR